MTGTAQPPAARLRRAFSPEVVAGLLSIVVVAVTLPFLLQALNTPMGAIFPAPVPSASVAGVAPSASSSPGARPSATSSAIASATGPEAWASEARVLVRAAAGLIELRDGLSRIADERPRRAADIARQLRAMNPSLGATLELVEGMEANGAPSDLVERVRKPLTTALEASLDTLRASLPNREAYRAGAADCDRVAEEPRRPDGARREGSWTPLRVRPDPRDGFKEAVRCEGAPFVRKRTSGRVRVRQASGTMSGQILLDDGGIP